MLDDLDTELYGQSFRWYTNLDWLLFHCGVEGWVKISELAISTRTKGVDQIWLKIAGNFKLHLSKCYIYILREYCLFGAPYCIRLPCFADLRPAQMLKCVLLLLLIGIASHTGFIQKLTKSFVFSMKSLPMQQVVEILFHSGKVTNISRESWQKYQQSISIPDQPPQQWGPELQRGSSWSKLG